MKNKKEGPANSRHEEDIGPAPLQLRMSNSGKVLFFRTKTKVYTVYRDQVERLIYGEIYHVDFYMKPRDDLEQEQKLEQGLEGFDTGSSWENPLRKLGLIGK